MRNNILQLSLFSILFFIVACSASHTRSRTERQWVLLGEQKVGFITETDEIDVKKSGSYKAIRFLVEDRPIHLSDLKIYFANGQEIDEDLSGDIEAGSFSRTLDLPGNKRKIDRIVFRYRTTGNILKGRALVKVYGRK